MQFIDQIKFGPFSTDYHTNLVDPDFKVALNAFIYEKITPQLDEPSEEAKGTLFTRYNEDRYCGPNSLVKNFFTLEMSFVGSSGNSEFKCDIEFHPETVSFTPRPGRSNDLYAWTPSRKENQRVEREIILRFVNEYKLTHHADLNCPICGGEVFCVDDSMMFVVRCRSTLCFDYNYHKDEDGNLLHGHFFKSRPVQ